MAKHARPGQPAPSRTGGGSTTVGDQGAKPDAVTRQSCSTNARSAEDRFRAIDREFKEKQSAYLKLLSKAKSDLEKSKVYPLRPDRLSYAKAFYLIAKQEPRSPITLEILFKVYTLVSPARFPLSGDKKLEAMAREQRAMAREVLGWLHREYAVDPRLKDYIQQMGLETSGPQAEAFLRDVLARNPDHEVQGIACGILADMMSWMFEGPQFFAQNPSQASEFEKEYGREMLDWMRAHDPVKAEAEAIALHSRVLSQYGDVKLYPAYPNDQRMVRQLSETWLRNREELAIGKKAPEIDGKDVEGHPMKKLSAYQGKIVALVFWASWCGHCMKEIPTERDANRAMSGRPFVLLGVNCDYTPQDARAVIARESITWPNWFDGDPRLEAPIKTRYHLQGLPAVFLLDAHGVIRAKNLRGQAFRDTIETMVKELEATNAKSK